MDLSTCHPGLRLPPGPRPLTVLPTLCPLGACTGTHPPSSHFSALGKVSPIPTFCITALRPISLGWSLKNDKQFLQQQAGKQKGLNFGV